MSAQKLWLGQPDPYARQKGINSLPPVTSARRSTHGLQPIIDEVYPNGWSINEPGP